MIGRTDDADQKRLAPGATGVARDLERERARTAQNGERRGGLASAGRRTERSRLLVPARTRNADRAVAALAQKVDDLLHRLLVGKSLRDIA